MRNFNLFFYILFHCTYASDTPTLPTPVGVEGKEKQEEIANANKANEDDEDIELDAKDMKVRVPDKFLYKILQKRL